MDSSNIRSDIESLKSIETSPLKDKITSFFNTPGGSIVQYTFMESKSPQELQRGLIGTATELHHSLKAGDTSTLKEIGLSTMQEAKEFLGFISFAVNNIEDVFNAYNS